MCRQPNRRDVLRAGALAGLGFWVAERTGAAGEQEPDQKLNVAVIGCGGRGAGNLEGVKSENLVAFCDVDDSRAAAAYKAFPKVPRYRDFRKLLEEQRNVEAVVISTPDHVHAYATVMALELGKHVYCEKPLTRTVHEARRVREAAAKAKVATQMGNQGAAGDTFRKAVEIVRSGAVGKIREVHVWTNRPIWPQGLERPVDTPPVPGTLDWDLWLGPAPARPYHPAYVPFKWRGWWDFGTGALGDMACHTANLAFLGLQLGHPTSVEPVRLSDRHPETAPKAAILRFQFPMRGLQPPVSLTWYDGGNLPPRALVEGRSLPASGSILVGEKGVIFSPSDYGNNLKLLPEASFKDFQPPEPTLPRVGGGHHREWIQACKGMAVKPLSRFDYAALFTETVVLGAVACRLGQRIDWDGPRMRAHNLPEAEELLNPPARPGWTL